MKYTIREKQFIEKSLKIKLICMDVDGVLTDGGIYIDQKGNQNLRFDVKDGLGIKILQKYNFVIALISGGEAKAINKRAEMLDINLIKTKVKNKFIALKDIQKELNVTKDETVFLGDDINDLSVLPLVSMFLVPENAHKACIKKAFWIGKNSGGYGFVREFTDKLLLARGINPLKAFISLN